MSFGKLEEELLFECKQRLPDYLKMKDLIKKGANVNATNEYGETIVEELIEIFLNFCGMCIGCIQQDCNHCMRGWMNHLKRILEFLIEQGFQIQKYGLQCIGSLVLSTYDEIAFDMIQYLLGYDLDHDQDAYKEILESIAREEVNQRCVENCEAKVNLFYAMYQMVDHKRNGKPFEGIYLYQKAIGQKVQKILYFSPEPDFVKNEKAIKYHGDIGMVCEEHLLIIGENIHTLVMDDRYKETPQIECQTLFGEDRMGHPVSIIGAAIVDISFDNKKIIKDKASWTQPIIWVTFDNGIKIKFTCNWGEVPREQVESRFEVEGNCG